MLSVIVPVYQTAEYLDQCVESILSQTHRELELLLVDDGSTDGSGGICDRWAERDARVRVFHQKNSGAAAARNTGLEAAAGEYVTFADSDDWLEPGMYGTMLAAAREHACDVVLCDCRKELPGGPVLLTHPIRPGYYDRAELEREYFPRLLMREDVEYPATASNCLLLFRRERLGQARYLPGLRRGEDLLFGGELMLRAESFYYIKGFAPYHYRMTPGSVSRRYEPGLWEDHRRLLRRVREVFGGEKFDFSRQIDLCGLFYLYHAISALRRAPLSRRERGRELGKVLGDPEVRVLLSRLDISALAVSRKQRCITRLCRSLPRLLILYYGGIP